jgi:hypothetical protein
MNPKILKKPMGSRGVYEIKLFINKILLVAIFLRLNINILKAKSNLMLHLNKVLLVIEYCWWLNIMKTILGTPEIIISFYNL